MRKILFSICILFATLSLKAQSISGIRIDGGNNPILVYFGGNQMCLPTTACFVANLRSGYYMVEVYATRFTRPGERPWKGQKLYSERVYFKGSGVKDISVDARDNGRPGNRPNQNENYPDRDRNDKVMSARLFDTFYASVVNERTAADRIKMVDAALVSSDFTCDQCLRITKLFVYDNDKMIVMRKMYPRIVDKQAFFSLIGTLKYTESKDKMNTFVRDYNASNR